MNGSLRHRPLALALALSFSICPEQGRASESEVAARAFQAGVEHARTGELDAAILKFQEAYRISPNYLVLYNLGQTLALMGKPVEAVDVLKKYLDEGGSAIDGVRRKTVEDTIAFCEKRIGSLAVRVSPADAVLELDGQPAPSTWRHEPVRLASGRHALVVTATGHGSQTKFLVVEPGQLVQTEFRLEAERKAESSLAELVQLQITCGVPGVVVMVDGREIGRTPLLAPLLLPQGRHRIRFERKGYVASERELDFSGVGMESTSCNLHPTRVSSSEGGELLVRASEPQSSVLLDGQAFHGGVVPTGEHALEVRRVGFHVWTKQVHITPGSRTVVTPRLIAQPEYAADYAAGVNRQRNLAFVLGGAGVVATGVAVGLWVAAANEHARWEDERTALSEATDVESALDLLGSLHERSVSVQRLNSWALGSTFAAGALLSAGAALYLVAGSPHRYGSLDVQLASTSISTSFKGSW